LVVWAKRILAEHDAFKAEVDAVRSGITGTLRLGTVPTASTTASLVLSAFCSAHPLAKVHLSSRLATTELYRRLREFELDAVIVHPTPEHAQDVDLVPLYQEHYVLLAGADLLPAPSPSTTSPSPLRSRPTLSLRYSRKPPPATGPASCRTRGCGRHRWPATSAPCNWLILP
jgi:DNA-binding transcriptional LysR family regulator